MSMHLRAVTWAGLAVVLRVSVAAAQEPAVPSFRDSYDGDCTIAIEMPPTIKTGSLVLRVNRHPIGPPPIGQWSPLVVRLD
jgi:hypothetical protein